MLGYNRTITRTNINVLINIGPGAGGGRKRRGKKGNLPNTFDDDCSTLTKSVLGINCVLDYHYHCSMLFLGRLEMFFLCFVLFRFFFLQWLDNMRLDQK